MKRQVVENSIQESTEMAQYERVGPIPKIILLVLLLLVMVAGGAIWFDYLGVIDAKTTLAPILRLVGLAPRTADPVSDDPGLLDAERLAKREEALALREDELEKREAGILEREREIARMQEQLEARERDIEDREISFNERMRRDENKRAALVQNSRDLTNMRPDDAVKILTSYDDQLLIDTLRVTEELAQEAGAFSFVSLWLSQMPSERAAEIQRKMTIRAEQ
jgi:flagellar protein FlbB